MTFLRLANPPLLVMISLCPRLDVLNMFCNLFYIVLQLFVEFGVAWKNLDVDDDRTKACFSKHSQWPPKSFRPCRVGEFMLLCLILFYDCPFVLFIFPLDDFSEIG